MSELDNAIRNTLAHILNLADAGDITSQLDRNEAEFKKVLELFNTGRKLIPNYESYKS